MDGGSNTQPSPGVPALYPVVAPVAIAEAIDLERQLRANLSAAA